VVILYYSRSSKTKIFAEALGELLSQPVHELVCDLNGYTGIKFLFKAVPLVFTGKVYPVSNMPEAVPDEIYLCCPVWGGQMASPAKYFLDKMDLKGKTVNILLTAGTPVEKYRQNALNYLTKNISCNPGEAYIFTSHKPEKEIIKEQLRDLMPNM